MKSVAISEFKGKFYVDIREYYEDKNSGESKPGKKGSFPPFSPPPPPPPPRHLLLFGSFLGISLTPEQWQALKDFIPKVDAALKKKGH